MANKLPYIRFYVSDFLAASAFMPGKQRAIYSYLLLIQADQGAICMTVGELANHLDCLESDVQSVLDSKFDFNPDVKGWINERMEEERASALQVIENKRIGAAKARAAKESLPQTPSKKEEPEPKPKPASTTDTKVGIKVDTKKRSRKARPASIEEVEAFAKELGMPASDGSAFWYGKEGNGWKNGSNPVKDWRATFRNWKQNGHLASQRDLHKGPNPNQVYRGVEGGEKIVGDFS